MLRRNTLHQAVNRLEHRQHPGQVPAADELIGFGEAASYAELPVVYELEPGYFAGERPPEQPSGFSYLCLGAVQCARPVPDADLQLPAKLLHQRTGQRGAALGFFPGILAQRRENLVIVGNVGSALNRAVQTQRAQSIDQRG